MKTLRDRTKAFAVRVIRAYVALPKNDLVLIIGRQFVRSGTSVGAHCREGYRSRSNAELISKYESALQELDETVYWLELLVEAGIVRARRVDALLREANEIIAILVASVKTIKRRNKR